LNLFITSGVVLQRLVDHGIMAKGRMNIVVKIVQIWSMLELEFFYMQDMPFN